MSESLAALIQNTLAALETGNRDGSNVDAPIAAGNVPGDYNGNLVDNDLSAPQDYTTKWGKVCVVDGNYNLCNNMCYAIWLAQNSPAAPVVVTADHLRVAYEILLEDIARWNIYAILAAANVIPRFRTSDIVKEENFNAAMIAHLTPVAARFYANAQEDATASAQISQAGYLLLHALFANALHRAFCNNHSWITADMFRANSMTRRCLGVLSADLTAFTAYMEKRGHDGNHHLTTDSLSEICDAISGFDPAVVVNSPRHYAGRDIANTPVHEILTVSESAIDRWPATQMGKSAMIVALNLVGAVYVHLSGILKIDGADLIAAGANGIAAHLKANVVTREKMKMADTALAHLVSVIYGYACHVSILDPDRYAALKSHANRDPASEASGRALAGNVLKAVPNNQAVVQAVRSSLISMAQAISSVAAILEDDETGNMMAAFDANAVTAETGIDDQAKLEKLLKMVREPTKGTTTE